MSIRSSIERFRSAEDGSAAILWAISLVVVLGLVALAFDIGRLGATQSELQSFADNVALAAAGELDGKPDAITRSQGAAANLISDAQTFANGGQALAGSVDYTLTFYASLPTDDTAPITDITTDPAEAVFAEVVVTPHTVSTAFRAAAIALLGGTGGDSATVGASAVAGYTQEACDITPLMFCLPPGFKADQEIGTMIQLRSGGGGSAWGPGNFGFLEPEAGVGDTCEGLTGANLYRCLVGAEMHITQCVSQRGVDIEPRPAGRPRRSLQCPVRDLPGNHEWREEQSGLPAGPKRHLGRAAAECELLQLGKPGRLGRAGAAEGRLLRHRHLR